MKKYWFLSMLFLGGSLLFTSCKDDDKPEVEEEVEVITNVTVTFTNTSDATDVVTATAVDPDGEGVQSLAVVNGISLKKNQTYNLALAFTNALDPDDIEDITEEVEEEGAEHQVFFKFTNNAFVNPTGDGNFDNSADPVNYVDLDANNNPIGLSTNWTTDTVAVAGGFFQFKLKHQPDVKTAISSVNDGDTDVDLTFTLDIE